MIEAIKKELEAIKEGKDIFTRMKDNPTFWDAYLSTNGTNLSDYEFKA